MYKDEFEQFVFHDATARCGLKPKEARVRVAHHSSWIHHALVRLGYAESAAERRAAQREIEQDIRHIQARHGWGQELMTEFHRRRQAALTPPPKDGSGIPAAGELVR